MICYLKYIKGKMTLIHKVNYLNYRRKYDFGYEEFIILVMDLENLYVHDIPLSASILSSIGLFADSLLSLIRLDKIKN